MKKIYLGLMAASAALVACDPITDNKDWSGETMSETVLSNGITLKQYDLTADGQYVESADGNYIEFATNPGKVVDIYYVSADGTQMSLSRGKASGIFQLAPSRGSDPLQTIYFQTYEYDGSSVTTSKQVTVKVATELSEEMLLLCSNAGSKAWYWDDNSGMNTSDVTNAVWGNMGADASWGGFDIPAGGFCWWGVEDAADLKNQTKHAVAGDFKPGEADMLASMVFNETGSVKCYDKDGNVIRSGSFSVEDYKLDGETWKLGTLHTSEGATLFPYEINGGGKFVTDFEIHTLTPEKMLLVYPDGGKWSGWQEATYWAFKASDPEAALTSGEWTWDDASGMNTADVTNAMWGNMGADASWGGLDIPGGGFCWWGVENASQLKDQANHAVAGDFKEGEADNNAYMVFDSKGLVNSYDANGKVIRSGTWELQLENDGWKLGTLKTSEGATLFPYEINGGGKFVTEFEIHALDMNKMLLVYPDGGKWSGWQEATFWAFKKK